MELLVSTVFDTWTVLGAGKLSRYGKQCLRCRCVCGHVQDILLYFSRCKGCDRTSSLRMWKREALELGVQWEQYSRLRAKVHDAIRRCTDEQYAGYRYYGGRGIQVHPDWLADPKQFVAYLLTLEGCNNTLFELDRKDNSGSYEPGNLRFTLHAVNMRNSRVTQPWEWQQDIDGDVVRAPRK